MIETDGKPLINIAGDFYRVQLSEDVLTLVTPAIRDKTLRLADMDHQADTDRFTFLYDRKNKAIFELTPDTWQIPDEIVRLDICGKAWLDAKAFSETAKMDPHIVPSFLEMAERQRYSIVHPRVSLAGHDYFFDTHRLEFVDALNPSNRLPVHWFNPPHTESPTMLYNTRTRTRAGRSAKEDRNDWVEIKYPSFRQLEKLLEEAYQHRKTIIAAGVTLRVNRSPRALLEKDPLGNKARLN